MYSYVLNTLVSMAFMNTIHGFVQILNYARSYYVEKIDTRFIINSKKYLDHFMLLFSVILSYGENQRELEKH